MHPPLRWHWKLPPKDVMVTRRTRRDAAVEIDFVPLREFRITADYRSCSERCLRELMGRPHEHEELTRWIGFDHEDPAMHLERLNTYFEHPVDVYLLALYAAIEAGNPAKEAA